MYSAPKDDTAFKVAYWFLRTWQMETLIAL